MNRVTIDGLTFTAGDPANADHGLERVWLYRKLQGWYSGPSVRGASDEYPTSDGASPISVAYRSARALKFTGALYSTSPQTAVAEMWMRFASIQASGEPIVIEVEDAFGTLSITASLNGSPVVDEINGVAARVEADFIAYDPIKYGTPRAVPTGLPSAGGGLEYPLHSPSGALFYGALGSLGRVTLTNAGTAAVWPTLNASGQLDAGFFIQRLDTGQQVRYDRVVPDGSTVSIDFRTGEVLIDGESDGSTYLTRYEFFQVGPGESVEVQFNSIGGSANDPTLTVTIADGYW